MVTKYIDKATGLEKYHSNLEDWIWIDDIESFPFQFNSNRDNWQLTHPENQALRKAIMAHQPRWYIDLHGSQGVILPKKIRKIREEMHKWKLFDHQLPWAGFSATTVSTQYFGYDPQAAWKGVFVRDRFGDPRYLRFSGLSELKKSWQGYKYPEANRWEMDESLKMSKICLSAMEQENNIFMEPIGLDRWNGNFANPCTAHQAAAEIPEFNCASILIENMAGGGGPYGDNYLEKALTYMESAINAMLKYIANIETPDNWQKFPVFQGPHDVWTKREFINKKVKTNSDFYEYFFPDFSQTLKNLS
jgi:hypothetical protein